MELLSQALPVLRPSWNAISVLAEQPLSGWVEESWSPKGWLPPSRCVV